MKCNSLLADSLSIASDAYTLSRFNITSESSESQRDREFILYQESFLGIHLGFALGFALAFGLDLAITFDLGAFAGLRLINDAKAAS